jgi:membrane fusion protein, multidrug efflux system
VTTETNQSNETAPRPRLTRRRIALLVLSLVFACAALGYGGYWAAYGRFNESTDDAYVAGNEVPVMAEAAGTVTAVYADDTSEVKEGQVLARLDDSDATVKLQEAEAQLATTVRHVEQLYATARQLNAQVAVQQATLDLARSDYTRHKNLNQRGYYSASALEHSATQVQVDEHNLVEARQALSAVRAQVANTDVMDHPDVKLAAAAVRAAYLNLARMTIVAPVTGYVAKRDVQLGQHVDGSAPLMVIVPLNQIWVNANFKESQLDRIRPGQPVTLHSDLYGNDVTFHGTVAGVNAGTGSAFALLPAQNATGNWIKVVQRVPVRVSIANADLTAHPLRIGLSMDVDVDTRAAGTATTDDPQLPTYATSVYSRRLDGATQLIASIIRANSDTGDMSYTLVQHDR